MDKAFRNLVREYLIGAGFLKSDYVIDDSNETENYIEVFFRVDEAVKFIVDDVKKTEYDNIIEIREYKNKRMLSALFIRKHKNN